MNQTRRYVKYSMTQMVAAESLQKQKQHLQKTVPRCQALPGFLPDMIPRNVDDSPIQFSLLLIVMTLFSRIVIWSVTLLLMMLAGVR